MKITVGLQSLILFASLFLPSCWLAAAAQTEDTPGVHFKTSVEPLTATDLLQVVGSLVVVLCFIVIAAWMARRFGSLPMQENTILKILASQSVGQRERVVLVQVEQVRMLLGVTSEKIQILHVLEAENSNNFKNEHLTHSDDA